MEICHTLSQMDDVRRGAGSRGQSVALAPTMGALHEGHFSLIRAAKDLADFVVVSIFVNPTQFGPGEDLEAYPRMPEQDLDACRRLGVDAVFMPSAPEMYPREPATRIELPSMADKLCGASRPGHFAGVCLVVAKLLNIVRPDVAVFGQKDYQQVTILRRMVEDLNMPHRIHTCPTVREADGLALSSRNAYLTDQQRRQASGLYAALRSTADLIGAEHPPAREAAEHLRREINRRVPDGRIDYARVVDPETLVEAEDTRGPVVLALAVHLGKARLIDNLRVD
jgi:pantoate--beta-alanine ligase